MITPASQRQGADRWQVQMRDAWRDPRALLAYLDLDPDAFALSGDDGFEFLVTRAFAERMRPGDPADPLLRQVLPVAAESRAVAGFGDDPVGDGASRGSPGVLHKYAGRALLVVTGACPIHCRYCFRRAFDYATNRLDRAHLQAAVDFIAERPDIREVILSGGDPLMLATARLRAIGDALAEIAHIERLRIHTRTPVTLPGRIDDALLDWLGGLPWPVVVVLHANHANEFGPDVARAIGRLRGRVHTVFNQAVLLAGVNDDADRLQALVETGFDHGVVPYYLHLLDRVAGSAHHEVDEARARALLDALRTRVSGYLVPRLVRERAGAPYKLPVL